MRRRVIVAALTSLVLAVAGCTDGESPDAGSDETDGPSASATDADPSPSRPNRRFKPDEPAGFSPCDLLSQKDVVELAHLERGDTLFSWQLARYGSTGVDTCRIGERSTAACAGCDFGQVEVGIYTGHPERSFKQLTSELTGVDRPRVGDRAVLSSSSPARYTLWTKVDDAIVFLYVQQSGSEPLLSREVVQLARRAVANLPADPLDRVGRSEALPKACDTVDRAAVETVLGGSVVLARGNVSAVSATCDYQADNPTRRHRSSATPRQLALHVELRKVDDVSEFVDELAAGDYGPAKEIPDLGRRAVFKSDEHELLVMVDDATMLTVEGFLAFAPEDHRPRAALISVAESALTMLA